MPDSDARRLPRRRCPVERLGLFSEGVGVELTLDPFPKEGEVGEIEQGVPVVGIVLVLAFAVDDADAVRYAQASTLVRLTGPRPEILRPGPVSAETIDDVLSRDDPGVHAGTHCDG